MKTYVYANDFEVQLGNLPNNYYYVFFFFVVGRYRLNFSSLSFSSIFPLSIIQLLIFDHLCMKLQKVVLNYTLNWNK